jgi:hypothetical protein
MSEALSCIPLVPLIHVISENEYLGDAFTKMNLNFCNIETKLNTFHRVGDFKSSLIDEDHDGWKIVNTERDLPRDMYPQLECLVKDNKICLLNPITFRLPTISPRQITVRGEVKTMNSFLYIGNPVVSFEPPPKSKCYIPYDLEERILDCEGHLSPL